MRRIGQIIAKAWHRLRAAMAKDAAITRRAREHRYDPHDTDRELEIMRGHNYWDPH